MSGLRLALPMCMQVLLAAATVHSATVTLNAVQGTATAPLQWNAEGTTYGDDAMASGGTASWFTGSTSNNRLMVLIADSLRPSYDLIDSIQVRVSARSTINVNGTGIRIGVRLPARTDVWDGTTDRTTTTYQYYTNRWTNNPWTNARWTWAQICSLQAGARNRYGSGGTTTWYSDHIQVLVHFTPNQPPVASAVNANGTITVGQTLTGAYTYSDAETNPQGTSTYKWYRSNDAAGAGKVAIAGATAQTYVLTATDEGKYVSFEVTPVATAGATPGTAVESTRRGPIAARAGAAPVASLVGITGDATVLGTLTGSYTYSDADGDLQGASTFQWLRDGVAIAGATGQFYALTVADEAKNITFRVTPVALTGTPKTGTAVASPSVGPVNPANGVPPVASLLSITGSATVGQTLTGSYLYTDGDGDAEGSSVYRWRRGGTEISGATATTYVLQTADEGALITFEVSPVAATGAPKTGAQAQSSAAGPIAPRPGTAPVAGSVTITGTATVGQTLAGSYVYSDVEGDLEGATTYRWLRGGVAIPGANAQTYLLVADDEGATIAFEVSPVALTGTPSIGTAATSEATSAVDPLAGAAPVASAVTVSGTLEVGQTISATYSYADADGDMEGVSLFQWYRGASPIAGATASSYTLVVADEGTQISFDVTPVAQTGTPKTGTTVLSSAGGPVAPQPGAAPEASSVEISGTSTVGQTLTGSYVYGDVDGDVQATSTFHWLRNGSAIPGATATTYVLVVADEGATIQFEVTPVAATGSPKTGTPVASSATQAVAPQSGSAPVASALAISGSATVGGTLSANYTYGDADGDAEGISTFRWLRNGVAIAGATSSTYDLTVQDEAASIVFEATPVALTGAPKTGLSAQTGAVGPIAPLAGAAPTASAVTITGTATVGQVLTGHFTYADADGDVQGASTFRWLRDGAAIAGATASTYTLEVADEGAQIRFEITPIASTGSPKTGTAALSSPTAAVAPASGAAPGASGVSITGDPTVGASLTGQYTYADADADVEGASTFRWLRNGVAIAGAVSNTYVLTSADETRSIVFEVTPVAMTGSPKNGSAVQSVAVGPVGAATGVAPVASAVSVSGTATVGLTLSGVYTYSDGDADAQGVSTYAWLRNGVAIPGATSSTYTLTVADEGTQIAFEVTPVAATGAPKTGVTVTSAQVGPVSAAAGAAPTASAVRSREAPRWDRL